MRGLCCELDLYSEKRVEVPLRQVVWAQATQESLEVSFLSRGRKKELVLEKIEGQVDDGEVDTAIEWAEALVNAAYTGLTRCRRLKVLVNPHSGVGKAPSMFTNTVEPILRSARCSLDVTYTTHARHGYEIAKDLALQYDAIVTLSGDGLIHEVINGFAHHSDPPNAFSIPIVPVPLGSGNALSLNLLGINDGFDVSAAALNVLKGRPMKSDLFSITQNGRKTYSFMSQALGLMADLDIGTENLRWMGDTRFLVGLLRGVLQPRQCPVTLSVKVAEQDKHKMVQALHSRQKGTTNNHLSGGSSVKTDLNRPQQPEDEQGWITFDKPILYVYAGQGPYVGRDLMAFPVSLPDDGMIDVIAQELTTRGEILSGMVGAQNGNPYWRVTQHYFKAHAYRVKPLVEKGHFAVDGEVFPFEEFTVEVQPAMATFLSQHGHYAVEFTSERQ